MTVQLFYNLLRGKVGQVSKKNRVLCWSIYIISLCRVKVKHNSRAHQAARSQREKGSNPEILPKNVCSICTQKYLSLLAHKIYPKQNFVLKIVIFFNNAFNIISEKLLLLS